MQSSLHLSRQLCHRGRDPPVGNWHCPLLIPSLQPCHIRENRNVSLKAPLPRSQGPPVFILCLLCTWICSGAGGRGTWSREALEFPILGLPDPQQPPLFVLLELGEGLGLSRPHALCRLCRGQTTEQGRLLCFLSFFLTGGQEARHSPSSPLRSLHPVPCPPPTPPSRDRNKGPASGARGQGQVPFPYSGVGGEGGGRAGMAGVPVPVKGVTAADCIQRGQHGGWR